MQGALTPEPAVLRPHGDVDAVVLSSALGQRFLQGSGVQHEAVVEAAGDVVHLWEVTPRLKQTVTMGMRAAHTCEVLYRSNDERKSSILIANTIVSIVYH